MLNYNRLSDLAEEHNKTIWVDFLPIQVVDWEDEIADNVGAYFLVDMAHIAGLVAAGVYPPIPCAW